MGEEAAGARTLQRVARSDHHLVAVLTSDPEDGRGTTMTSAADRLGVRRIPAGRVRDPEFGRELRELGVDVLLNVHSLHLIRAEVLAAPRVGAFNLHPGPLPGYAGLNVPSWALADGADRHGVTLHWMEPGIDTGDVAASAEFPLTPEDTGLTVSVRCAEKGLELVDQLLSWLADDPPSVPRRPQDLTARRYFGRAVPYDGWVPWASPARTVLDFVRACDYGPFRSPWGVPRAAVVEGEEFGVVRTAATGVAADRPAGEVTVTDDAVLVATADDWVRLVEVRAGDTGRDPRDLLATGKSLVSGRG